MLLLFGAGVVTAGAQSPGGVKGTELWFQTLPVTADLQGAYRWMDLAGDSVKLRSLDRSGKPGSEYTQTRSFAPAFNFHPALYLSGGSYGKTASFKFSNFSQATVFSVFALPPESHDKDMLLYSLDGRKGGGSILQRTRPYVPTARSRWTTERTREKTSCSPLLTDSPLQTSGSPPSACSPI